ncbi:hypothetical protein ABPG74_006774, partial [Tetrahymena malaccensis]
MQQQNPFTEIQDYFNDQIQSFVLKTRTTREKRDVTTKQLDRIYEQLKYSIDVLKKEYELLICQKLIEKINLQNPQIQNLDYVAQSSILKEENVQEKREITSIQPNCSYEEIKYSIDSLLKGYDNVNRYLAKAWYQLYFAEEYEEKKIGMSVQKLDTQNFMHSNNTIHRAALYSAQSIKTESEFDKKMEQYIEKKYPVYNVGYQNRGGGFKKLEKEICLRLNFDTQSDTISYFIQEEDEEQEQQNQISFEIKFNPNNESNSINRIFKIFNSIDLKRFKALKPINIEFFNNTYHRNSGFKLQLERIGISNETAKENSKTQERCQKIAQMDDHLIKNNIGQELKILANILWGFNKFCLNFESQYNKISQDETNDQKICQNELNIDL